MTPAAGLRRFQLVRHRDISGVSGTGVVALGVLFPDGKVVTRWMSSTIRQTCTWDSLADVEAVHGHGGATQVEWIDPEPWTPEHPDAAAAAAEVASWTDVPIPGTEQGVA